MFEGRSVFFSCLHAPAFMDGGLLLLMLLYHRYQLSSIRTQPGRAIGVTNTLLGVLSVQPYQFLRSVRVQRASAGPGVVQPLSVDPRARRRAGALDPTRRLAVRLSRVASWLLARGLAQLDGALQPIMQLLDPRLDVRRQRLGAHHLRLARGRLARARQLPLRAWADSLCGRQGAAPRRAARRRRERGPHRGGARRVVTSRRGSLRER